MKVPDHPSAVSGVLRRPFREQVIFFRQKMGNLVPTARWDDLTGAAHDTAFMVAGAQKADLLADLAASVDRAIAEGKSLDAFRKEFDAAVERHDWHGWTGEDSKGGRAWRTRTIYRTNATVSYAAGRHAQLVGGDFALWVYRHGGSKDPRPEHLNVFDGLMLPPDHPFWVKFYPPSDWGCSCYVLGARSARGGLRLGGDPHRTLPKGWNTINPVTGEPAGIGKGWGYAPGASVVNFVNEKLKSWPAQIAADFVASLPVQLRLQLNEPTMPIVSVRQLTEAERAVFSVYSGEAHERINGGLRDTPPVVQPEVPIMTEVLSRARLGEDITVYRGLKWAAARRIINWKLKPGDVYTDAGFSSTSRIRSKAENFRAPDEDTGVLLIVHLPHHAHALDIATISEYGDELEVVVQRSAYMEVISWDADKRILEVEIPPDE